MFRGPEFDSSQLLGVVNQQALQSYSEEQEERIALVANDVHVAALMVLANQTFETLAFTCTDVLYPTFTPWKDWCTFNSLAHQWKEERANWRSFDIARDPNYLQIIGMGETAVPFILARLSYELATSEPDHWFTALWAITRAEPVEPEHQGNTRKMALDWLAWGVKAGYWNAGVGARFPATR